MSRRATEFLVWRVGNSVAWACSPGDIADELNLTRKHVLDICKRRGWVCKERDSGAVATTGVRPLDKVIRPGGQAGAL